MKDYHNRANFSSILMHSMSTIFSCRKSKTTLNQSNCTNQFCMHGRTAGFIHLEFGQETAAWQVACYNYFILERLHNFHEVREVAVMYAYTGYLPLLLKWFSSYSMNYRCANRFYTTGHRHRVSSFLSTTPLSVVTTPLFACSKRFVSVFPYKTLMKEPSTNACIFI